jgi:hypothetical protein
MIIHLKTGLLKKFQDFKHVFNYTEKILGSSECIFLKNLWKKSKNFIDVGSIPHAIENGKNKIRCRKRREMRPQLQISYFIDIMSLFFKHIYYNI